MNARRRATSSNEYFSKISKRKNALSIIYQNIQYFEKKLLNFFCFFFFFFFFLKKYSFHFFLFQNPSIGTRKKEANSAAFCSISRGVKFSSVRVKGMDPCPPISI